MTADRAYGSGDNLHRLQIQGINAYIPLFSGHSGTALQENFTYEKAKDRYQCPTGNYLGLKSSPDSNRKTYIAKPQDCQNCDIKKSCLKNSKINAKRLQISLHQELFNQVQHLMTKSIFLKKLGERFWKMEGLMAEAKNRHGLKRAKYRGRSKMQIQAYIVSTVQNMKRLLNTVIKDTLLPVKNSFSFISSFTIHNYSRT